MIENGGAKEAPELIFPKIIRCESTGCIQWIIDPLAHCNCDSPLHACNTYSNYKDCSPEYIADLKK